MKTAVLGLLALGSVLSACGDGSNQELQAWMAAERKKTAPKVTPLAEPKKYFPQRYSQDQAVEPFSAQKMALAFRKENVQSEASSKLIAAETARRKEPLEAVPLDTMAMVGSLNRGGNQIGLIRIDKLLYQVQAGNYLGQNYGRISKISETEIALREIVQDAGGEWIERTATLQLQERAK
jgi:type IV pilus assembly protein PilP